MLIGGQGVLLYGEPRLTQDVDVTLGIDLTRLSELVSVVREMGFELLVDDVDEFVRQTWVLPTLDGSTGLRVDFILSWTEYERKAIERAHSVQVEGYPVRYATAEDLIIHKIFSGRARDLEDVRSILIRQQVNLEEIKRWLNSFEKSTGEDYLSRLESVLKELPSE